jgi:flagellar protein FliS
MESSARDTYLTTQIETATPCKLRLMLIEGALRFGQQAKQCWGRENGVAAAEALLRCHKIVGELLANVASPKTDLSRKLSSVYLYLFRTLSEVRLEHDEKKLDEVLSVLAIEQQTWLQVCEKHGAETPLGSRSRGTSEPDPHGRAPHSGPDAEDRPETAVSFEV